MLRLDSGTYAGDPGETVTLTTRVAGSGSVSAMLDGTTIAANGTFSLKSNPGDQTDLRITLFGATGDSCAVGIAVVDGGTDGDLLVCQPHDPAPVHFFTFVVAQTDGLNALRQIRSAR